MRLYTTTREIDSGISMLPSMLAIYYRASASVDIEGPIDIKKGAHDPEINVVRSRDTISSPDGFNLSTSRVGNKMVRFPKANLHFIERSTSLA